MSPACPGRRAARWRTAAPLVGALSTAAIARMAEDLPWFRELSAEDRSWVGMIVQAGVRGFVDWFEHGGRRRPAGRSPPVFGAAPRALAGVITPPADRRPGAALDRGRREQHRRDRSAEDDRRGPRGDLPLRPRGRLRHRRGLRPGRRGRAARGTPGSRPSSSTRCCAPRPTRPCSRAPARWAGRPAARLRGARRRAPPAAPRPTCSTRYAGRRGAGGMDALCAVQGERLVVCSAGSTDPRQAAAVIADLFGDGPVVVGPVAADLAGAASRRGPRVSALPRRRRAGRTRRARCWPTTCWPSGPSPATDTPGASWSTSVYLPLLHAARRPGRDADAPGSTSGVVDRGRRAGALRAPQHGPLPPPPGRRPHRPRPGRAPRRVHAADRPGARPPVRPHGTPR